MPWTCWLAKSFSTGELNVFEEILGGSSKAKAGIILDGIGYLQPLGNRLQLRLLPVSAVVRSGCVGADGHAPTDSIFGPVEVVGAFRVLYLTVIDQDPVRFDPASRAEDDWAEAPAFRGVDTLGDIHLHGALPRQIRIPVRIPTL